MFSFAPLKKALPIAPGQSGRPLKYTDDEERAIVQKIQRQQSNAKYYAKKKAEKERDAKIIEAERERIRKLAEEFKRKKVAMANVTQSDSDDDSDDDESD